MLELGIVLPLAAIGHPHFIWCSPPPPTPEKKNGDWNTVPN